MCVVTFVISLQILKFFKPWQKGNLTRASKFWDLLAKGKLDFTFFCQDVKMNFTGKAPSNILQFCWEHAPHVHFTENALNPATRISSGKERPAL